MARQREFDKDDILRAIVRLFWDKGYEATSYADLMETTGLGKGSLYSAFGDKRALYLQALRSYCETEAKAAADLFSESKERSARERTESFHIFLGLPIEPVETARDRRGCFLCNAAVEQAPQNEDVQEIVLQAIDLMRQGVFDGLEKLRPGNSKNRARAEQLVSLYFGLRVMAKAGTPVDSLKEARDEGLQFLTGL